MMFEVLAASAMSNGACAFIALKWQVSDILQTTDCVNYDIITTF